MPYKLGDIVNANVPGARHNPRPILVIGEPNEFNTLWFAGFSHVIPDPLLPHMLSPDLSDPGMGLTMPCILDCSFTDSIDIGLVVELLGTAKPEFLELALRAIERFMQENP